MPADLHCHTIMSDGSVGIEELVSMAKRAGIDTLAVTDHDTFAGVTRAKIIGERIGVRVIPGIEISAFDQTRGRKVHILGYRCAIPQRLEGLCHKTIQNRKRAALIMLQKVMRLYPITPEMVARRSQCSTNIYRQHIMHALIDAGVTSEFYGDLYHELFDPQTGCAHYPVEYPNVREVIRQIRDAGGIAVLAHPSVYDSYELMEELAAEKLLDGVEAYHSRNKPNDSVVLTAFARRYGLLTTGGTDFHGMYAPKPLPLGQCTTPEESLRQLLDFKRQ